MWQVRWDGEVDMAGANRVSPWDIEPTGSALVSDVPPPTAPKKSKISHPPDHLDHPIPSKFTVELESYFFQS